MIYRRTFRPIASAGLDALDELLFRRTYLPSAVSIEVLDQNQRSLEHQFIAAKFAIRGLRFVQP